MSKLVENNDCFFCVFFIYLFFFMRRLICNCLVKCSLMICKSSSDIYTIHTPTFRDVHAFIVTYIMHGSVLEVPAASHVRIGTALAGLHG